MNKIKQFLLKTIMLLVSASLKPAIKRTIHIIEKSPIHHGEPMEFIGEHTSLLEHTLTYQCPVCKTIQQVND
jgi:hypothetical protein